MVAYMLPIVCVGVTTIIILEQSHCAAHRSRPGVEKGHLAPGEDLKFSKMACYSHGMKEPEAEVAVTIM